MTANATITGKISAAKTALILFCLLAIWLMFVAMPSRKNATERTPPAPSALVLKLRAVGLTDNSDLDGLPEIFAIWAEKAEWKDGQTTFAYWHLVDKTYTYYFQAVRVPGGFRFKAISEPHDPEYHWDESLSDDCPIRFYTSVHKAITDSEPSLSPITAPPDTSRSKEKVNVTTPKIETPLFAPVPLSAQPKH